MLDHVFELANANEVKKVRVQIIDTVKHKGYALIRGLSDLSQIKQALQRIFDYANHQKHRASQGVPPKDIRKNMSKWSIGGHSQSQSGNARFMLTMYNPMFTDDTFNLHPIFQGMLNVRDILANRDVLTDEKLMPNHFNACRVQIYPAGGGFMSGHVDSRASANLFESSNNNGMYIQLVLLLTQKGHDYHDGGAFVVKDSNLIDSEQNSKAGDILVYDGSTYHGVSDIDPTLPFDSKNLRGRAVALATVYNMA